ncbi:MAG: ATP-dependent RNA helicase DeaD [Paracoccaceae bacterium]
MKQPLADALEQRGYSTLTQVQEAVTKPELQDADLLVSAQTGSGKTVAFGLALAQTLLGDLDRFEQAGPPLALVIAPTRELALQVKRELSWLYANAGAVVASCVGGMDMREERRTLGRGAHIVVATPGRLRDHIMRKSIDLSEIRGVVLDEADEMLDLGFREDLEFILGESPEDRRTLMFSATVPRAIGNLAKSYQRDAVRVTTGAEKSQHSDIEYQLLNVAARDSENAIINVLRYYESPNALVFANTRAMVNRLTTRLSNRGFSVVALSGELSQSERTHALQAMRDGRARICVATDVAARGIDLPNLDLVVHAELPTNHETLLHRSGRTGRAGRKGVSVLITPPAARRKAQRILSAAKLTATMGEAPSAEAVMQRDRERMMDDPAWLEPVPENQTAAAAELLERFSAEQIAAAYLRLYQSRQSAPEELSASGADEKPQPRVPFGPSVWFSITGGRAQNAEPRRYLPMLCKAGNVTKDDIGAIRIQETESFVEIRQEALAGFLAAIGTKTEIEPGAVITQLDRPPSVAKSPRPKYEPKNREDRGDTRPAAKKPSPSSAPVDWNDDPAPRTKKPKPAAGKPRAKPKKPEPDAVIEPVRKRPAKTAGSYQGPSARPSTGKGPGKGTGKGAGKGAGKPTTGHDPKGPPPPTGKTSSKKNRIRDKIEAAQKARGRRGKGPAT